MTIKERTQEFENISLSKYACKSADSKGRDFYIDPDDNRTCFQRDRDRIIHCKSFRRLKHKTQVFLAPVDDHYRDRLTHTLEVSQIARSISRALRLNEDLTEAIALGHDLGHTPFGHAGERALNERYPFRHSLQSKRVVEKLERGGEGLNLTWEVRDGIVNHGMNSRAHTLEGRVVRLSDKIAYINHDMDDAMRAGILKEEDIPEEITSVIGDTRAKRLDFLIKNIIENSLGKDDVTMDEAAFDAMITLRNFMFEHLYFNPTCKGEETKAVRMLLMLYDHYIDNLDELPRENIKVMEKYGETPERAVCDYISGMTDYYSVSAFRKIFIPEFWGQ